MASRALKIEPEKNKEKDVFIESPSTKTVVEENEQGVAALAYLFWQERGCPIGSDQEDWFRAEETLKKRSQ